MAEGVYSNGLPHPSREMRARIARELGILALLTAVFLGVSTLAFPQILNTGTYWGLALVALGMILYKRHEIRERIWGPPESPEFDRVRRCFVGMSMLTIPPLLVFLVIGIVARLWFPGFFGIFKLDSEPCSMISIHFIMTLCVYLPWALLQQTLFQFYLLGRLRALLPFASPWMLSTLNGIAYGLVHLAGKGTPVERVMLTGATIIGGILWSYSYYRDRYVLPLAISHALLATTFFYWVIGRDIAAEWIAKLVMR